MAVRRTSIIILRWSRNVGIVSQNAKWTCVYCNNWNDDVLARHVRFDLLRECSYEYVVSMSVWVTFFFCEYSYGLVCRANCILCARGFFSRSLTSWVTPTEIMVRTMKNKWAYRWLLVLKIGCVESSVVWFFWFR